MAPFTRLTVLWILLFVTCSGEVLAGAEQPPSPVIRLDELSGGGLLGKKLSYYEDPGASLDLADIIAQADGLDFRSGQQDVVNLGISKSAVWVRMRIENPTAQPQSLYLEYSYPVIDHLRVHYQDANGQWLEKRAGDLESQPTTDVPENRNPTFLIEFRPGLSTVYFQIQGDGSMQVPVKLLTRQELDRGMLHEYTGLALIYGIFLVMILYNLLLCLWFRSLAYLLYVVFICISTINMMNLQGLGLVLFPREIGMLLSHKLGLFANLSLVLCLAFGRIFLGLRVSSRRFDNLFKVLIGVAFIGLLSSLVSYNIGIRLFVVLTFVGSITLIAGGVYQSVRGFRPAYFFTLSWTFILMGHMLLQSSLIGVLPINFLTTFGAFIGSAIEIVLLSLAMGDKMRFEQQKARREISKLFRDLQVRNEEISSLNQHLEKLVEDKTRNIRSILKNIRQGLFMMGPDRKIMADSSDYLQEIFEERQLEGRDAFELLFKRTSISSDVVNQSESVIGVVFQEGVMVFDINEHLLCREVSWQNHKGETRILEYHWSPMIKDGIIDRILVTVKDITEHKMLEQKHREKEEELKMLGEIVNIDAATFRKFIQQTRRHLVESQSLCAAMKDHDSRVLRKIYVNLHTMKGAARGLYLSDLANEAHQIEQLLQTAMRDGAAVQNAELGRKLGILTQVLDRYVRISAEKLGRGQSEEHRIELDSRDISRMLVHMEEICTRTVVKPRELLNLVAEQRRFFYRSMYTDLETLWNGMRGVLEGAARELGKEPPELLVQSPYEVMVTAEGEELLANVFIHILRNAVDHGLESPEERARLGKAVRGRVEVQVGLDNDHLLLEVGDDGSGLNLAAIRQKAEKQGLLTSDSILNDALLAELIFTPGFSTRDQVSLISGRGVGMDAVKTYLLEKGGHITLKLLDRKHPEADGRFFTLQLRIPARFFRVIEALQPALAS